MNDPAARHEALVLLQNELGRFVVEEHTLQRDSLRRLWASPVEDRVTEGRCIADLTVVAQPTPGHWVLQCAGNDSRFREGDLVRLSRGDPQLPFMEASILAAGDTRIEVLAWRTYGETACAVGQSGICADESFIDLEARYLAAIDDLGKTDIGREIVLPLLGGKLGVSVDATTFDDVSTQPEFDQLNDRQQEAVANAIASDTCWLIQGPPGTGKTHVLAWMIGDLLRQNQRVFVTSFTHRAINNLLAAVAERVTEPGRVAKIAAFTDPTLPAAVEQRERFSELTLAKQHDGRGYVIGATPFALRSSRLGQRDFDTIVIDEASQVTVPLAVMAMLAGRKYIFAGDHQQLPPVTLSRSAVEARSLSIFGRLVGRGHDTLLTTTHRFGDALCAWPSDTFYQSRLRSHPRVSKRQLHLALPPRGDQVWHAALAAEPACVWLAVPHRGCRSYAPEETTLLVELLRALHAGGLDWEDIGVVVPFRRQARFLRRRLASKSPDHTPPAALVIDTVERMQGQEREVVCVSFTTSDPDFAHRLREFLFLPQRLNVAATRPRSKLILLASPELLDYARSSPDDDLCAAFVSLLESAHRIDIPLPEQSPL